MALRIIPWILRRWFNAFQRQSTSSHFSRSRAQKWRPKSLLGRPEVTAKNGKRGYDTNPSVQVSVLVICSFCISFQ